MRVPFWKVESVGNDFVLVDAEELGLPRRYHYFISDTGQDVKVGLDLPELARRTSPRRFSVGSDGLLVVDARNDFVSLRMFNPDGSEDFCGNGLRCAARYVVTRGVRSGRFEIHHGGLTVPVEVEDDDTIRTILGNASFAPSDVPLAEGMDELFEAPLNVDGREITLSALSTGSTHTVVFGEALPEDEKFERLGRALEHHSSFPDRTSVIWVVVDDQQNLRIRIWERGAGETQGCGTGSSAAAVVHFRRRGEGGAVHVHNPGGTLRVSADSWDAPITVEGRANLLFSGTFEF